MTFLTVLVLGVGLLAAARWGMAADQLGDPDAGAGDPAGGAAAAATGTGEAGEGGAGDGDQATGGAGGAEDPWQGELPDHARERFGVSKYGELLDRFETMEAERTQQAEISQAYQDLIRMYQSGLSSGGNGGQAGAGVGQAQAGGSPSPANNWFGYGSKEAYVAAFHLNPAEVRAREQLFTMEHNPQVQQALRQMVQSEVQPLQQAAYNQALEADYRSLTTRYPEAADKAVDAMVVKYAKANPWIERLKRSYPEVNLHEVAFKLGHYDQLRSELAALRGQQKERAGAAGTARANVGGAQVRKAPKTHLDAAEAAAERLRAQGIEVSQEMVEIAKRGINSGGVHSV